MEVWQTSNLRWLRLGEEKKKERKMKKGEETTESFCDLVRVVYYEYNTYNKHDKLLLRFAGF